MPEDVDMTQLRSELRNEAARVEAETQVEVATTLLVLVALVAVIWGVNKLIQFLDNE